MRKQLLPFITAGLLAVISLTSPAAALASPCFVIEGGYNALDLNDFEAVTDPLGITVSRFGNSVIRQNTTFSFPIDDGTVDAETVLLQAVSKGGVEIKISTDVMILNAPIVNVTGPSPVMTFLVTINGNLQGRYAMFDLTPPVVTQPANLSAGERINFPDIVATLSKVGAHLLNLTFATTLTEGQPVGTVTVKARLGTRLPG